jgi:hypothetical protein
VRPPLIVQRWPLGALGMEFNVVSGAEISVRFCPNCGGRGMTWSIDEQVSPLTQWPLLSLPLQRARG